MSQNRFVELCCENCVLPEIALENEKIVEALRERDDKEVERLIREEF